MHNDGNYVISLGAVTKWLGEQAEALGVEIFPGFTAAEVLYDDKGAVRGVATGNLGIGKDGEPHEGFQLGMELLRQVHAVRRRRARPPGQAADRQVQARRRARPAELCHRHQGAVGDRPGQGPARPRGAHRRLADGQRHLRRRLPLPPGRQQGHARLRGRAGLQEPVPEPLRGDAALEDAPQHPRAHRRRQAHRLRRARHHRRRHPEPAQDGVPGRRADRLRRRLPERQPHQGQPCGDQDRHAVRRSGLRGAADRAQPRRAGRLPRQLRAQLAARGAGRLAQLQAVVQEGPRGRQR